MYAPSLIANTFLELAFKDNVTINSAKLNRLIYFSSCEYLKLTNGQTPLTSELFSVYNHGPALQSIHQYYEPLNGNTIEKYMRLVNGESKSINIHNDKDIPLSMSINKIWLYCAHLDWKFLSYTTHEENSAWDKSFQNNKQYINNEDMTTDFTYYKTLGFNNIIPQ